MRRSCKWLLAGVLALTVGFWQVGPALACGGLVAPNGSVRLGRAATLVAWHAGIEYYLTTFSYQGDVSSLGWIVPLPTVPLSVQEGGAWSLQRLQLEVLTRQTQFRGAIALTASHSAQVVQQLQIEALDISVVKGSASAVLDWAAQNGFILDDTTRAHLLVYGQASPVFMAAKFNTSRAKQRGLLQGDGTPILITMRLPRIWVPLEVLALDGQQVNAALYLLTDQPLYTSDLTYHLGISSVGNDLPGAPGFSLVLQEPLSSSLYHDLSTDRNMGWVWPHSWLTYLSLNAPAERVTYDLSVNPATGIMQVVPFGTAPQTPPTAGQSLPSWLPVLPRGTFDWLPFLAGCLLFVGLVWVGGAVKRRAGPGRAQGKSAFDWKL
jgi:hypothetical protein